jgi:hypothetical protein
MRVAVRQEVTGARAAEAENLATVITGHLQAGGHEVMASAGYAERQQDLKSDIKNAVNFLGIWPLIELSEVDFGGVPTGVLNITLHETRAAGSYRVNWTGQDRMENLVAAHHEAEVLDLVDAFLRTYADRDARAPAFEMLTARLIEQLELVLRDHRETLEGRIAALTGDLGAANDRIAALEREVQTLRDAAREKPTAIKVALIGAVAAVVAALIGGTSQVATAALDQDVPAIEQTAGEDQVGRLLHVTEQLAQACADFQP